MWILAALLGVPLIEIALFIEVGGVIGVWPTIAVVAVTAIIGTALLRRQGLATIAALQDEMRRGGDPSPLLAHGALILVAGVLLLTPGFFTDAIGFALMVPAIRGAVIGWAGPRLAARVVMRGGPRGAPRAPGDETIEAEYRDVTAPGPPDDPPPRTGS